MTSVPGKTRLTLSNIPHITHPVPFISRLSADGSQETVKPYSIIVGAFQIKENADRLVARLQNSGFEAFIIDVTKGGLHRVCLQSFADRNQALQQLAAIRSGEFTSAWLLQK
jgi:cell division septation protein DedD